jgi:hypothetical protein
VIATKQSLCLRRVQKASEAPPPVEAAPHLLPPPQEALHHLLQQEGLVHHHRQLHQEVGAVEGHLRAG